MWTLLCIYQFKSVLLTNITGKRNESSGNHSSIWMIHLMFAKQIQEENVKKILIKDCLKRFSSSFWHHNIWWSEKHIEIKVAKQRSAALIAALWTHAALYATLKVRYFYDYLNKCDTMTHEVGAQYVSNHRNLFQMALNKYNFPNEGCLLKLYK